MGKKFIKVSDVETANLLTKLGFQLIDKTSGIYTFLNNTTTKFSNDIMYCSYNTPPFVRSYILKERRS